VNVCRALAAPLGIAVAAALTACLSTPRQETPVYTVPPESLTPPPIPDSVPDAIPRIESRARSGNPPFYDVFGRRYYVLSSSVGYWERGVASWYGPGFHKVRTSTGEPYDMYAMTAAHKTLPLPAYVRVTNLLNGRSIVVRVNDRGPFVGNRIIDLSYSAAAKLDMLRNGTAMVDVRTIDPSVPTPVTSASMVPPAGAAPNAGSSAAVPATVAPATVAPATVAPITAAQPTSAVPGAAAPNPSGTAAPTTSGTSAVTTALFVQAGAFSDPANAQRLAEKLRGGSFGKIFVRDDRIAGRRMYRVRIGPVANVAEFDRVVAALERAGINDAHLALD
jgi:rare lipoprotein A